MKKILANDNIPNTPEEKQEKKRKLEIVFKEMLDILGFDQNNDPNLKDTPKRMAKMYVDDLYCGNFENPPKITVFPNTKNYDQMIVSGPIQVKSSCSHHGLPFFGQAWLSYIPGENVIGLSKLARIVQFYMRRPQIQEELTEQIANHIENILKPKGIMVVIKANHMCMCLRGANEPNAMMTTSAVRGAFAKNPETRKEFFDLISLKKD